MLTVTEILILAEVLLTMTDADYEVLTMTEMLTMRC